MVRREEKKMSKITKEMVEAGVEAIKLVNKNYSTKGTQQEIFEILVTAVLEAAEKVRHSNWQPIETAPTNRSILLYCQETKEQFVSSYMICLEDISEMWVTARVMDAEGVPITIGCKPSMWRELPTPPEAI